MGRERHLVTYMECGNADGKDCVMPMGRVMDVKGDGCLCLSNAKEDREWHFKAMCESD